MWIAPWSDWCCICSDTGPPRNCSPAPASEKVPFGVRRCQRGGALVLGRRLGRETQPLKQVGSRGVERVVALEVELVDQLERGSGPLDLADRDRPVEGHDRRGGEREQLVV